MNPPNGQGSLDYLNQIAPEAPKPKLFQLNLATVLIGAGVLIAIVLVLVAVTGSIANSRKEPWQRLSARLTTTSTIAEDAAPKLKSSALRSLNSDLRLYLTNTQRDLAPFLEARTINADTMPEKVLSSESSSTILESLEDGRLNAKYDTTYAREMGYLLATLVALLDQMEASSSEQAQSFLGEAHDNLVPIYEGVQGFSTRNE